MALIDFRIENLPQHPDDSVAVPIPDLAHRVLEIYWLQVRPFEGRELRQVRGSRARILAATNQLSAATNAGNGGLSLDVAMVRAAPAYQQTIDEIVCTRPRGCRSKVIVFGERNSEGHYPSFYAQNVVAKEQRSVR